MNMLCPLVIYQSFVCFEVPNGGEVINLLYAGYSPTDHRLTFKRVLSMEVDHAMVQPHSHRNLFFSYWLSIFEEHRKLN